MSRFLCRCETADDYTNLMLTCCQQKLPDTKLQKRSTYDLSRQTGSQTQVPKDALICRAWYSVEITETVHFSTQSSKVVVGCLLR